jgi:hypothetical protein
MNRVRGVRRLDCSNGRRRKKRRDEKKCANIPGSRGSDTMFLNGQRDVHGMDADRSGKFFTAEFLQKRKTPPRIFLFRSGAGLAAIEAAGICWSFQQQN